MAPPRTLVAELTRVATFARSLGDGRLAVLGHSMASDVVVRYAEATPDVAATIAVSMFSPVVTATSPPNLLVIVGDWESMLKREALRAVGLSIAPRTASPGITYGDSAKGTARRAAFSAHVEHASVLFSQDSMREALGWLDRSFGTVRTMPPVLDDRGPWILLLVAAVVLLALPLSTCLPRVAVPPVGAGLGWRRLWRPLLVPMIATPLVLRVLPTHFLPVLVGDYLAVHFAVYGLITALTMAARRPQHANGSGVRESGLRFTTAVSAVVAFGFIGLVWPIDSFVTSFVPGAERLVLICVMLIGTLLFFLSDEWMTRGEAAARGAYLHRSSPSWYRWPRGRPRLPATVLSHHHRAGDRALLPGVRPLQRLDLPAYGTSVRCRHRQCGDVCLGDRRNVSAAGGIATTAGLATVRSPLNR